MKEADKVFAGSVPALYERYLGPMIFEPYAQDLAKRLARLAPKRILETAAGTGIVTRAIARALPADSEILATDLNQAMLDRANESTTARNVAYRQADAQSLTFEEGSFDAVVCQFGVMFFPDRPTAFAAARRVLRPGGIFLFNVWDRIETNDFAHVTIEALARLYPANPPRFLARTPHGHHDTAVIVKQLGSAGFIDVEVETLAKRSRAPSAQEPAIGYCQGTPLRGEIEVQGDGELQRATDAAAAALSQRFGQGSIEGGIQAHVIVARR